MTHAPTDQVTPWAAGSTEPGPPDGMFPDSATPGRHAAPSSPQPAVQSLVPVEMPTAERHRQIAKGNHWQFVDLDREVSLPAEVVGVLKGAVARTYNALPVNLSNQSVTLAVADPNDHATSEALRPHLVGYTMRLAYANPQAIRRHIDRVYSAASEATNLAAEAHRKRATTSGVEASDGDMGRLADSRESEIVAILRLTIDQALRDGASDIHIEPTRHDVTIRYAVNGLNVVANRVHRDFASSLVRKIKVDAKMATDNSMTAESGVLSHRPEQGGEPVEIRVETVPSTWGVSCTLRLQQNVWRRLSEIGLSAPNEARYREALSQPYGIILTVGPTGSGKTTLLYSSLRERMSDARKIITLERPVEHKIASGATQIHIREDQGMTFQAGLESALRQAPHMILVGEIANATTARTAVDAAMTGHQVLSTLHTNSAAEAIPRMARLDVDTFVLSSSLLAVVGQRLVARLCDRCRIERRLGSDEIIHNGFHPDAAVRDVFEVNPEGCADCVAGIVGRLPIHEVLLGDEELREAIASGASERILTEIAVRGGMTTMRLDGWARVQQGLTSLTALNDQTRREFVR